MRRSGLVFATAVCLVLPAKAQGAPAPTIASVMEAQLKLVEAQCVAAAESMPEDKYRFVPLVGEQKGVRTFALEVRHVATVNLVLYRAMLGQAPPPGIDLRGVGNGPEELQTKADLVGYLKQSFALGHQAFAALTAANLVSPVDKAPIASMNTRLAMASFSVAHSFDHYGQMAEYLRLNGIVPPGSVGQPLANPAK